MSESNLHFRIKEYLMKLSNKKDLIKELNEELDELNNTKNKLKQEKERLKKQYNIFEKQKKNIIINSSKDYNVFNIKKNFNYKINNNNENNIKKRNFSATKPKRRLEINIIKDLKKQNKELEDIYINFKNELNNIIQQVNEMEIKCKLLMIDSDKNKNLIKIQK